MRLLDLFCGVELPYNSNNGIMRLCLKLYVGIAGSFLKHNEKRDDFVQSHVRTVLFGPWRGLAHAVSVKHYFNSEAQPMRIGSIVQTHAQRNQLRKIPWRSIREILVI